MYTTDIDSFLFFSFIVLYFQNNGMTNRLRLRFCDHSKDCVIFIHISYYMLSLTQTKLQVYVTHAWGLEFQRLLVCVKG